MNGAVQEKLPAAFAARMRESLGTDAEAFFASYETPRAYGLRYNPLKMEREQFGRLVPFALEPVPWAREGYYYKEAERPGRHPFHEMGLYYIQEPSAMCVAHLADPQPGERVLDLCAAPGGKATQLAGRLAGEGLLVCNEPVPGRAKILSQNIERMGIKNAVVLNHTPQELERRFPAFFDKIVVDAPCSGEGMFHKEEAALTEWSPENVMRCAARQREILASAAALLRPGGVLVYSTCTFAPEENEEMAAWFLAEFPEFHPVPVDVAALGLSEGGLPGTVRIYPHRQKGEGHFAAKLQKGGAGCTAEASMAGAQSGGSAGELARAEQDRSGAEELAGAERNKVGAGELAYVPRNKVVAEQMMVYGEQNRADLAQMTDGTWSDIEEMKRGAKDDVTEMVRGKQGGRRTGNGKRARQSDGKGAKGPQAWQAYEMFAEQTLFKPPTGRREMFGEQLYLLPEEMPGICGLKVLRPGLHLGTNKKNRFEPSHALALALKAEQVSQCFETQEPEKYLRGETLVCDASLSGWTLVTYRGFPLGWGKASRGVMKNHYPKGLRVSW